MGYTVVLQETSHHNTKVYNGDTEQGDEGDPELLCLLQ